MNTKETEFNIEQVLLDVDNYVKENYVPEVNENVSRCEKAYSSRLDFLSLEQNNLNQYEMQSLNLEPKKQEDLTSNNASSNNKKKQETTQSFQQFSRNNNSSKMSYGFITSCADMPMQTKENIDEYIKQQKSITFTDKLINLLNNSGEKDSEIYKRANIDRRLFSKIISNRFYHPAKDTVIAFSLALKLNYEECKDLLASAGYTFSRSSIRDIILEYLIKNKFYNIIEVNLILYEKGEVPL